MQTWHCAIFSFRTVLRSAALPSAMLSDASLQSAGIEPLVLRLASNPNAGLAYSKCQGCWLNRECAFAIASHDTAGTARHLLWFPRTLTVWHFQTF